MHYIKRACGKTYLSTEIYCIPQGNTGFGNLTVDFVREKQGLIPQENNIIYQLSFSDEKIFLLGYGLTRKDKNKAQADRKCHASWAS